MSETNNKIGQNTHEYFKSLINLFLAKYPEYHIHLNEAYFIYPSNCDTVAEMLEIITKFIEFFTPQYEEEQLIIDNRIAITKLIILTKVDRLERGLEKELEVKMGQMTVKERRNYLRHLIIKLGSGDLAEGVNRFIIEEFEAFDEIERDDWLEATVVSGVEMLRNHCAEELERWNNYEEDTDAEHTLEPIIADTAAQKILLLYELGILDHLADRYHLNRNFHRIGQILEPLIDVKGGTIAKAASALYSARGDKNSPQNNPNNNIWVQNTMSHLKLKVQEINK